MYKKSTSYGVMIGIIALLAGAILGLIYAIFFVKVLGVIPFAMPD